MEGPFWTVVVILLFIAALYVLADGSLEISRLYSSSGGHSVTDYAAPLAMLTVGALVVIGLLVAFGRHPRTRSATSSTIFAAIRTAMFLAGIVLFLGGTLQIVETTDFPEQVVLAMLSLFFLGVPLYFYFKNI